MSELQPLPKPRHEDGRLYSEDEIKTADEETVRNLVCKCLGLPEKEMDERGWTWQIEYPYQISSVYRVDRPEWDWCIFRTAKGFMSVELKSWDDEGALAAKVEVDIHHDHKPTAADEAMSRCKAALLMALEVGE